MVVWELFDLVCRYPGYLGHCNSYFGGVNTDRLPVYREKQSSVSIMERMTAS